jgi:hypothetical protein
MFMGNEKCKREAFTLRDIRCGRGFDHRPCQPYIMYKLIYCSPYNVNREVEHVYFVNNKVGICIGSRVGAIESVDVSSVCGSILFDHLAQKIGGHIKLDNFVSAHRRRFRLESVYDFVRWYMLKKEILWWLHGAVLKECEDSILLLGSDLPQMHAIALRLRIEKNPESVWLQISTELLLSRSAWTHKMNHSHCFSPSINTATNFWIETSCRCV